MRSQRILNRRSSSTRLYETVADHVASLISSGTLRPGERTPSVRELRRQLSVSTSTIMEAYRLLESRELVRARPQSGYYVRDSQVRVLPEPAPSRPLGSPLSVSVCSLAASLMQKVGNRDVLQLGAAVPSPQWLPLQALNRVYGRIARRQMDVAHDYITPPGYFPLRRQIARRLIGAGQTVGPDDIIITNGATEALQLCLRALTQPGDTVAIESPCFFGFLEALEAQGLRAREIPTCPREGIDLDSLQEALSAGTIGAVMLSTNFTNPLGARLSDANKRRLVELAAQYQVPIIDDDTYGELGFDDLRPRSLAAFDDRGWVLGVGSLSKTLSPGLRIGWCCPGRFATRVLRLKLAASNANAAMPQLVAATYLEEGRYDRHLRQLRRRYAEQVHGFREAVAQSFPPATRLTRPTGGHVLWVEMPLSVDALKLYDQALSHGICIAPGPLFSASGQHRHCLRLNLAVPWSSHLDVVLRTLGRLAATQL